MTISEFQSNRGPELKTFLTSILGSEFLNAINSAKPHLADAFPSEHAMIRGYAKIEGYELCIRTIIALTMVPKLVSQPEANYGVEDKKTKE